MSIVSFVYICFQLCSNAWSQSRSLFALSELNGLDLQALRVQLERCFQHLSRLGAVLDNADVGGWNEHVIIMKKAELDRVWSRYQNIKDAISANELTMDELCELDNLAIQAANRYGLSKVKLDARAQVLDLLTARPILRPSEIVLPIFSGDYTNWTSWRSEFVNKVKNTNLPVDAKIDILYRSLDGEARLKAGDTVRRDLDDFNRIWARLESRYDNKYQIICEHIIGLFELPRMAQETPGTIRFLIDKIDQELRSLRRFGYDTESWCPLMAVLLIMRMDESTRTIWEMEHTPNEAPTLQAVLNFLEKRLMALRNLSLSFSRGLAVATPEPSRQDNYSRSDQSAGPISQYRNATAGSKAVKSNKDNRTHPYANSNQQTPNKQAFICPRCILPHFMWYCKRFRSWNLAKRIDKVAEWGLCPCCLISEHLAANCPSKGCSRCENAKHNNMLCPKALVYKLPSAIVGPNRGGSDSRGALRNRSK